MDVTLTKNQQAALEKFIEAVVGEEPSKLDHGNAANGRRQKRAEAREWLHRFASLSMRIGAHRARATLGLEHNPDALAIWKDPKTGAEEKARPIPDGRDDKVVH